MTQDERNIVMQQLANLLMDNANNRLTLALINGIVASFDQALPVDPPKPSEEASS